MAWFTNHECGNVNKTKGDFTAGDRPGLCGHQWSGCDWAGGMCVGRRARKHNPLILEGEAQGRVGGRVSVRLSEHEFCSFISGQPLKYSYPSLKCRKWRMRFSGKRKSRSRRRRRRDDGYYSSNGNTPLSLMGLSTFQWSIFDSDKLHPSFLLISLLLSARRLCASAQPVCPYVFLFSLVLSPTPEEAQQ